MKLRDLQEQNRSSIFFLAFFTHFSIKFCYCQYKHQKEFEVLYLKFSVGYQLYKDSEFINKIIEYKANIYEVYFSWGDFLTEETAR